MAVPAALLKTKVSHWGKHPRYVLATWFCHPCDENHDSGQVCAESLWKKCVHGGRCYSRGWWCWVQSYPFPLSAYIIDTRLDLVWAMCLSHGQTVINCIICLANYCNWSWTESPSESYYTISFFRWMMLLCFAFRSNFNLANSLCRSHGPCEPPRLPPLLHGRHPRRRQLAQRRRRGRRPRQETERCCTSRCPRRADGGWDWWWCRSFLRDGMFEIIKAFLVLVGVGIFLWATMVVQSWINASIVVVFAFLSLLQVWRCLWYVAWTGDYTSTYIQEFHIGFAEGLYESDIHLDIFPIQIWDYRLYQSFNPCPNFLP